MVALLYISDTVCPPTLFFFKILLVIPLPLYANFRISLLKSTESPDGLLVVIALTL